MKATRVGVVMGGSSAEREISLLSGEAVVSALSGLGYDVSRVVLGSGSEALTELATAELDVAFLALHGRLGEDGCVQGVLELLGVPYTGSNVLSSALAMDKLKAKELFRLHNVRTLAARQFGAHMSDDAAVARNEIEHLRDVFTERAQDRSAIRAITTGRRMHDGLPRQVGRQCSRRTPQRQDVCLLWRGSRGIDIRQRRRREVSDDHGARLQIIECELQLQQGFVHALSRTTELPALQARNLGHQVGDQRILVSQPTLERRDVFGLHWCFGHA